MMCVENAEPALIIIFKFIFQDHAERLVSVNEVFYEIKDLATQRQVENYPVPIEYLQPKPESIKFSEYLPSFISPV